MSFPVPLPSTFMPLPLAIMIPFMGIQSGVMAQQFGMNFQYGKRKISAMSNEEFNKLTPQQMQADFSNMITGLIPTFGDSLREMRPFQRMIFEEMLAVMKVAVDLGIDVAKAGVDPLAHVFGQHIHGEGVSTGTPQFHPQDEDKFQPPGIQTTKRIKTKRGVSQKNVRIKTLPQAGQTQILTRNRLINQINAAAAGTRAGHKTPLASRITARSKLSLKRLQSQLTQLLKKYNWI